VLAAADVVVYDRLAPAELLALAPAAAERIDVGKAPGRAALDQDGINALLVERGRRGETVVRLKGGDPFVFGRGGEEAEALAAAGVAFEIVPGVTSAIAAPAYAGVPVTHRGLATHVTIVTGHEDPAKDTPGVDWGALARAGGTLVVLMGAARAAPIAEALLAGGLPATTPVAVVRHGTRPDQHTDRTTLGRLPELEVRAPSAIVIGAVAGLRLEWFEARPLHGRTVVVTRAREQASELADRLRNLGAEVVELPAIAIEPVPFTLPPLHRYAWLVFTSANGVRHFFDRGLGPAGLDARALAHLRVAAIGPATADELARRGIRADLVPERFVAESLLEAFPAPGAPGERVLVARAAEARDVLVEGLGAQGRAVDVLVVYRTVVGPADPDALARVGAGEVDAVTFTSSSTVTNLTGLIGGVPRRQPLAVTIGPVTSERARALGWRVDAEAAEHTIAGICDALLRLLGRPGGGATGRR
jgi:uroporphyrinogen III methyltransferase/synthase